MTLKAEPRLLSSSLGLCLAVFSGRPAKRRRLETTVEKRAWALQERRQVYSQRLRLASQNIGSA
jgi:hypothetical protein